MEPLSPLVSLVVPVLNEGQNIPVLWSRIRSVTSGQRSYRFELVFVDDGSSDDTTGIIESLRPSEADNCGWVLVKLSRNFGHQAAISAGMQQASGEAVIFLDADLQDPPELIPEFLRLYAEGHDVVYGVRKNRKEPLWLRFCFGAFYRLFNMIADRPIPLDAGDFGLMSRRVVDLVSQMPERDRLIRGMRSWVGFRQVGVPYDRPGRYGGISRYGLIRRIDGALDGLFGFSRLPLRISLVIGLTAFLVCSVYLVYTYIGVLFVPDKAIAGWRSIITLAFMLGSANLIATAIVGEYVGRIYFQAKARPVFVVDEVVRSRGEG